MRVHAKASSVAIALFALAAASVVSLALASSAHATLGVSGFFGSQAPFAGCGCLAGEIDGPQGIAVNSNGNGAPAGTMYIAERAVGGGGSNNRIAQYSPAGMFVRAWGADVVEKGPSQASAVQRVTVNATGGAFKLTFKGNPTADIAATASDTTVETALNALPSISDGGGAVSVDGGPGNSGGTTPYLVTFDGGPLAGLAQPNLTGANGSSPLTGGAATVTVTTTNPGETGFEICEAASGDVCKEGVASGNTGTAGALGRYEGGGPNEGPEGVSIDQATGNVFVSNRGQLRVEVFTADGQFLRAFGNDVVASGPGNSGGVEVCTKVNLCKTAAPGTTGGAFGSAGFFYPYFEGRLAVAPLGAPNAGNVVVADPTNQRVQEFTSSGVFVRAFGFDVVTSGPGDTGTGFEICTGAAGDVCKDGAPGSGVGQFSGSSPRRLAVDSSGAIYTVESEFRVQKFTPQLGPPALSPSVVGENETQSVTVRATAGEFRLSFAGSTTANIPATATSGQVEAALNALPSISSGGGSVSVADGPGDASGSTPYKVTFQGSKFAKTNPRPMTSSQGTTPLSGGTGAGANTAVVATPKPGGPNSSGSADGPVNVAIGAGDHLFVSKTFPAGSTPVCPDGTSAPAENHFQELTPSGATVDDQHAVCNGLKAREEFPPFIPTSGMTVNQVTGFLYDSRAPNGPYPDEEINRVYVHAPGGPPAAALTSIDDIAPTGAVINGTVTPNSTEVGVPGPVPVLFHLEYKLTSSPTWVTYGGDAGAGAGFSPGPISVSIDGLDPNRDYEVRLVATKQFHQGIAITPPQAFHTLPAAPRIEAFYATDMTATSANLQALINPLGKNSTYRFEYGHTADYGSSAPVPVGGIPAGTDAVQVTTPITGLNGGTYHFRVVAENEAGTSTTADQTFTFYPPSCPNESLRQQTGASRLPDCRAYELVSPPRAGNVVLQPKAPVATDAISPARFAFHGFIGGIDGSGEPTSNLNDLYISTRTESGWVTRYAGIPADEVTIHGLHLGPEGEQQQTSLYPGLANRSLDRVLDWDVGHRFNLCCGKAGSYAPAMFSADGSSLGRLPTNWADVPGSLDDYAEGGFSGAIKPSRDFSHYVFSTAKLPFAPGGLTVAPGSVYDNDLGNGSVAIVSRTAGGDIPPGTGGPKEVIRIPGVSNDGTHILMSTKAGFPNQLSPVHLYMSVDRGLAHDVSIGHDGLNHGVKYNGMSADGEKVYFTSAEPLTTDDHDLSTDLFLWRADDPESLTRVSTGNGGVGDTDKCASSWIVRCGVEVVPIDEAPSEYAGEILDNVIAPASGDIYFYSPEQLVSGKGVPSQRNLYVYRNGMIRFVAAFSPSAQIERIQVTSDGGHMAMLTSQKLTTHDTAGHRVMYTYNAVTGAIQCVSCIPDGSPPSRDVEASINGSFLADDGRVFFTTGDPLVPEDINAKLRDVYEFVENRPQLITSGSSPTDTYKFNPLGLIGVSRDGVNVYFTTIDSLVGQDQNGEVVKFYVARTGGGIPFVPPAAPCQAADECHGPSSAAPPPVASGTSVPLGSGGNVKAKKKAKKGKKKAKKHRRKAKDRRHHAKQEGGR